MSHLLANLPELKAEKEKTVTSDNTCNTFLEINEPSEAAKVHRIEKLLNKPDKKPDNNVPTTLKQVSVLFYSITQEQFQYHKVEI